MSDNKIKEQEKEYTRKEALNQAGNILQPFREEQRDRHGKLLTHAGTIISVFVVVASIILFNYNLGYSRTYNLPVNSMSISMTNLLPLAAQICGGGILIITYIRHLLSDRLLGKTKYSIMRLFYGFLFCLCLIVANQFQTILGRFFSIIISLAVSAFVELCVYLYGRKIYGSKKDNVAIDKLTYDFLVEEYVFSSAFPGYRNSIIAAIIIAAIMLASSFGLLSAKAKREYSVFDYENESYAVIIDYNDKVLAQKILLSDDSMEIDTNTYYYYQKENIEFALVKFEDVKINKQEKDTSLATLQATRDEITDNN